MHLLLKLPLKMVITLEPFVILESLALITMFLLAILIPVALRVATVVAISKMLETLIRVKVSPLERVSLVALRRRPVMATTL